MNQKHYIPNIPDTDKKRVVIIGGGFAGLKLLRKITGKGFQIVMIDKNNFHQFQPLLYQVATAGLEPSAISFPVRKILQKEKQIHFRIAEINEIHADKKEISTSIGRLKYDNLVMAIGANTNFFGQQNIERHALSMKTASDAILIRNTILENFEQALLESNQEKVNEYLNIILVGGGPTGVELAGALAEMKKFIFPKDYPELDLSRMRIIIYEASPKLLAAMSSQSSQRALKYLEKLGVEVHLSTRVEDYNGSCIKLSDGSTVPSKAVIWAAGIKANSINGLTAESFGRVAQVAIQQANFLADNLHRLKVKKTAKEFEYANRGSMATIGRNLAVADLPVIGKIKGFVAWVLWSFVHLFMIVGVKNRLSIFINWSWNYFTYDQSLRLLIKPKTRVVDDNIVGCSTESENTEQTVPVLQK